MTTESQQLTWQSVPGATSYGVRLMSNGSDITEPVLVTSTSYALPSNLPSGPIVLTWSVTAYDSNQDYSLPSQPSTFVLFTQQGGRQPAGTDGAASPEHEQIGYSHFPMDALILLR